MHFRHPFVEVSSLRVFGPIFVGLLIIAVALGMAAATPNSTRGVSKAGNNMAIVPQGETLVLTYIAGKTQETWKVTHNGSQVVTTCSSACVDPAPATLCGVGCEVRIDAGVMAVLKVQLREDGAVDVTWPKNWPWTMRPYVS